MLAWILDPGVQSLHIDQENSKVTVYGTVKPQDVLEKVLRAGKTAEFWPVPAAEEVVGGKKKAVDGGDGGSAKKQKQKQSIAELLEYDDGDGEIVDEINVPEVGVEPESDTKGLMDKTPATPSKKARARKG